jgi:hypothetical protein
MFHYTDSEGFKAIASQVNWTFKAHRPEAIHRQKGTYFTDLTPSTPKLAKKLRVPIWKLEWLFEFDGDTDLVRIDGGRGEYIFYSPIDYIVEPARQRYKGRAENRIKSEQSP